MSSDERIRNCLIDIIENAARIARHIADLDAEAFQSDERTYDAVERCLERICEAGVRLGEAGPRLMPDQPWASIRGMGNRLRHAYDGMNTDIVWETAVVQVPRLASAAEATLRGLDETIEKPGPHAAQAPDPTPEPGAEAPLRPLTGSAMHESFLGVNPKGH